MKVLITGASGFAGSWLVRRLVAAGHEVCGTGRPGEHPSAVLSADERAAVAWRSLDLGDGPEIRRLADEGWDAVVHLAALASGGEARRDPGRAWEVNAAGTARLAEAVSAARIGLRNDPLFLHVSTGEVYGIGAAVPRREEDATAPCSPYAASKLGGEIAVTEVARRTGLHVVIARPFPHTGPGQDARFVVPALAERLRLARAIGAPAIKVGNLDPVRDFLDVRDVAEAYAALLDRGVPGQSYNIASGNGIGLKDVLMRLEKLIGWPVVTEYDPDLARPGDIPHLVGDPGRLRGATGWEPRIPFDRTLLDLLDAQAH